MLKGNLTASHLRHVGRSCSAASGVFKKHLDDVMWCNNRLFFTADIAVFLIFCPPYWHKAKILETPHSIMWLNWIKVNFIVRACTYIGSDSKIDLDFDFGPIHSSLMQCQGRCFFFFFWSPRSVLCKSNPTSFLFQSDREDVIFIRLDLQGV